MTIPTVVMILIGSLSKNTVTKLENTQVKIHYYIQYTSVVKHTANRTLAKGQFKPVVNGVDEGIPDPKYIKKE